MFLARHLEYTIGKPDLAWWQLTLAGRGRPAGAVVGIMAGIAAGALMDLFVHQDLGFMGGVLVGVVFGIAVALGVMIRVAPMQPAPVRGIHWPRLKLITIRSLVNKRTATVGAVVGTVFGLTVGIGSGIEAAVVASAVGAVLIMLLLVAMAWLFQLEAAHVDLSSATSLSATLAVDRRIGIATGVMLGVVPGLVYGPLASSRGGIVVGIAVGVGTAVVVGIDSSFTIGAWSRYAVARIWLALHHDLPWPLMSFLADAHRRGVLRQVGAVYQFRHIELQRRLATRLSERTDES